MTPPPPPLPPAEQMLSASALAAAALILWERDGDGRLLRVEGDTRRIAGCSVADLLAGHRHWTDHLLAEDAPAYREAMNSLADEGLCDVTFRIHTDVGIRWLREQGQRADCHDGIRTSGFVEDITAARERNREMVTLADHLGIVGQTSQAIMRCHHADELFRHVCEILARQGRFEAAWVCRGDGIHPPNLVAHAGVPDGLLTVLKEIAAGHAVPGVDVPLADQLRARSDFVPAARYAKDISWLTDSLPRARELIFFPLRRGAELIASLGLVANPHKSFDYGEMALLYGLTVDIAFALEIYSREGKRREAEAQMRLSAKVFDNSREGILITDEKRHIISVNRAFSEITGYSAEEVLGRNPKLLASGLHDEGFFQSILVEAESKEGWQGEIWNRRKSGELFPEFLGISVVRDHLGKVLNYIGIFSDITEQYASRNRLEFLAHHDALTGLPNRLLLNDRVSRAIATSRRNGSRVALIFLDLDNFKSVNDSLGHQAGDHMLVALSGRLRSCLREMDTLSRLGGDEFVVVLPELNDHRAATIVAEKILAAVEAPIHLGEIAIASTFSMGIALYPEHGEDFESLLKNADTAMYHAKERGKNTFSFYEEHLSAGSVLRLALQGRLHGAAERGELRLVYQPQVDVHDNSIIGAEALLRWHSPEFGDVSPAEFIPVAEESGLIVGIGDWVLEEVCRQIRRWLDAGFCPTPVAVNISPIQFIRGNLIATVTRLLSQYAIPPGVLEVEITESTMVDDSLQVLHTVQALKELGLMLSVDDFGTGYSNLSRLRQFNANKLKIDQSFVRTLERDEEGVVMVRTIIQMASSLKLGTIAEGVETSEQLNILRELGCQQIQGYLISRPISASDFAQHLGPVHATAVERVGPQSGGMQGGERG